MSWQDAARRPKAILIVNAGKGMYVSQILLMKQ